MPRKPSKGYARKATSKAKPKRKPTKPSLDQIATRMGRGSKNPTGKKKKY